MAQAVSLGCYVLLYRQVLAALGARVRFRLAADVVLASFLVSHLTPFGSAGRHVSRTYLTIAGIALGLVVAESENAEAAGAPARTR